MASFDRRAPAVPKEESAAGCRATLRDAVWIREGNEEARFSLVVRPDGAPPRAEQLREVLRLGSHATDCAMVHLRFRPCAAVTKESQPDAHVDVAPVRIRAEHVALTQERREGARERRGRSAERSRADEHVREAGMEPQTRHLLPLLGDAVTIVDRIERGEELPRLRERGARERKS